MAKIKKVILKDFNTDIIDILDKKRVEYPCNTPEILLSSIDNPVLPNFEEGFGQITLDQDYVNGVIHYHWLSDGLWAMAAEVTCLKDYETQAIYGKEVASYYVLTNYIVQLDMLNQSGQFYSKETPSEWCLYKPGADMIHQYSKGETGIGVVFMFTRGWLDAHVKQDDSKTESLLVDFLFSDKISMNMPLQGYDSFMDIQKLVVLLKQKGNSQAKRLPAKLLYFGMMLQYIEQLSSMGAKPAVDWKRKIERVEMLLNSALQRAFPGIEELAKAIHTSPTKLKAEFKKKYGASIFQYYQGKQMELALKLLQNSTYRMSIKELAYRFGYENPSNFTKAFKKQHGYRPSELAKKK